MFEYSYGENLNTSHVKVNLIAVLASTGIRIFKYISC